MSGIDTLGEHLSKAKADSIRPGAVLMKAVEDGSLETLEKGLYGRRADDWATQFMGTPLYVKALELTKKQMAVAKEMAECRKQEPSWRETEDMPRSKRMKVRKKYNDKRDAISKKGDALDVECREMEAKLIDHRIAEEKQAAKMSKSHDFHGHDWAHVGDPPTAADGNEQRVNAQAAANWAAFPEIDMDKGDLTPEKAKKILKDGEVHGKPITEQQRKYFGAVASGKAQKSMDGIESLEALIKGHGPSVGSTVTSSPQEDFGDAGAISGDHAAGAGGMPHGDTNFSGRGPEDGGEASGSPQGSPPSRPEAGSVAKGTEKLSEDDEYAEDQMKDRPNPSSQRSGSEKMMSKGALGNARLTPSRQLDFNARERAAVISQMQKSERIRPGFNIGPAPIEAEEGKMEKAQTWRRGNAVYSDASDRYIDEMQKSQDFYHGPAPSIDDTGTLRKSMTCPNGHTTSAMFSSCQTCGVGRAPATTRGGLLKSQAGLVKPGEERMHIPQGAVWTEDFE